MIEVEKTKHGFVCAYMEYYHFNDETQFDEKGKYLFINELWAHPVMRNKNIIDLFIQRLAPKYEMVKYVYWVRDKYNDRMSFYEVVRDGNVKLVKKESDYGKQTRIAASCTESSRNDT